MSMRAAGSEIASMARAARDASRTTAALPTTVKNAVLLDLAERLHASTGAVAEANAEDLREAVLAGLPAPKVERLRLTPASIAQLAQGLGQVVALPDPVGQITRDTVVASGLRVRKVRAPLGVVAMIYEARPGVTVDAFALCFKSGNACILKGGKEAARSNAALAELAHAALAAHGCPREALTVMSHLTRDELQTLLGQSGSIDLVIPRGGPDLIRFVHQHSTIPTVQHFHGVCHVFVDEAADPAKALAICLTGKTSAPATCNALECVLVHKNIADRFVPALVGEYARHGVEMRGTPLVRTLAATAGLGDAVRLAEPEDFGREFLDRIVAVRVVGSVDEAIEHIATYGSNHTDAIVTDGPGLAPGGAADRFIAGVHSSCVLVNASTRFNDGFQLGLGAEIGISTSRVHAYGPMGLEELTTQRYVVVGDGHVR